MKRDSSLDCLRVLACFLVVLLHVSAGYVIRNIGNYNIQFTIGNFFDSISRISVPLFVMLSGVFVLGNSKNKHFKLFYIKTFNKIVLPTFFWSLIYVIYRCLLNYKNFNYTLKVSIYEWLLGKPYYHLWYLYMIIGLYLITPILIRLKESVKEKTLLKIAVIFLIMSMILSRYYSLIWVFKFIYYIGYFMLGLCLKNYFKDSFNVKIALVIAIFSALMIFGITEYFVKYNLYNKSLYFYENLSPFVIIGSIFTFILFLNLKIENKIFTYLSNHTFNIYLIHAGILTAIDTILSIFKLRFNGIWYIPVASILIFGMSYVGSRLVNLVLNILIQRSKILKSKCTLIQER